VATIIYSIVLDNSSGVTIKDSNNSMQSPDPIFHKPKSIIAAKNIFYACVFIGFINVVIRDVYLGIANNGGILGLSLTIIGLGLIIFLIRENGLRKKWARSALLIIFSLMLCSVYYVFRADANVGTLEKILFVFRQVLQIVGMIFLFRKESNQWFNLQYQP
jgi:hypothetical protein